MSLNYAYTSSGAFLAHIIPFSICLYKLVLTAMTPYLWQDLSVLVLYHYETMPPISKKGNEKFD